MGGVYLDHNVSSGSFLSYEIEIGDGPGPELDKKVFHENLKHFYVTKIIKSVKVQWHIEVKENWSQKSCKNANK